jgi:hypothetical protein
MPPGWISKEDPVKAKVGLCAAAILCLSACGGGGGGSDPPAVPAVQKLQTAPLPAIVWDVAVMPTNDASLTLTGGGLTAGITTNQCIGDPPGTGYFAGQLADCFLVNSYIEQTANPLNGTGNFTSVYFLTAPYILLGCSPCAGEQTITVSSWTPPAQFDVGASGQLATLSATNPTDTIVETYAVTAYSPTAVLVTITETGQQPGDSEAESYTVDASGNEQMVSITVVANGQTVVFTP